MKITKRNDGLFEATIKAGKNNRKHIYGKSEEEVILKIAEELTSSKLEKITFEEVIREWYEEKVIEISDATKRMYEKSCFPKLISFYHKPIASIEKKDIVSLLNQINGEGNLKAKIYITLNQIFKFALDKEYLQISPMQKIKKPKYETSKQASRGLTENEKIILSTIELNENEKIFITLCLKFGLRRNECLAIKVKDIDLEKRKLSVKRSFDYSENTPKEKKPKSSKGIRELPILEEDYEFLKEILFKRKNPETTLIVAKGNKPFTNENYKKFWKKIKKKMKEESIKLKLEIDDTLTSRHLRHQFAITIKDLPIRDQMQAMGHASYTTTSKIYQNIGIDDLDLEAYKKAFKKQSEGGDD